MWTSRMVTVDHLCSNGAVVSHCLAHVHGLFGSGKTGSFLSALF